MDGEQQRVGAIGRLGRGPGMRTASGAPRKSLELARIAGITEYDLVAGAREDRSKPTAHEAGPKNSDAHTSSVDARVERRVRNRVVATRSIEWHGARFGYYTG
jgi:hypothetical protein